MKKIIDISVLTNEGIPLWPKSSGVSLRKIAKISKKNYFNETHIEMNAHVGTHIDAPLHFIKNGKSIDKLPLEVFMGEALVIYLPKVREISAQTLNKITLPKQTKRILFRTSNSMLWGKNKKFKSDYVGLTIDAAKWIVKHGIKLVGMDYLSIAKISDAVDVHRILLGGNTYILESLNLDSVKPGKYQLVCLPLKIANIEAAPARAILIKQ